MLAYKGMCNHHEEEQKLAVTGAWLGASLQRSKKIPKLERLISKPPEIDEVRAAKEHEKAQHEMIKRAEQRNKWLKENYGI